MLSIVKTLQISETETLRKIPGPLEHMKATGVVWTDLLVATAREISEIDWICDECVPELEVQSIVPGCTLYKCSVD
jgi:hypothetical protein